MHVYINVYAYINIYIYICILTGELQRCAIVLCLGTPADIYLVDEPSAYLDSEQVNTYVHLYVYTYVFIHICIYIPIFILLMILPLI
jgi:hypothetical protein